MAKLPAAYRSQKLTAPLPTTDGGILTTIDDAIRYMLALPAEVGNRHYWQRAVELVLAQADAARVTWFVHLALFYSARLDVRALYAERNG